MELLKKLLPKSRQPSLVDAPGLVAMAPLPLAAAAADALAFVLQALVVNVVNARPWGAYFFGTAWYTNVEQAVRYPSLLSPAKWAFAIWGVIYAWETVSMVGLALSALRKVDVPEVWAASRHWWLGANVCQAAWALLFATDNIAARSLALTGIVGCLLTLACRLAPAVDGATYWGLLAPLWIHAGWTTAASLVNWNFLLLSASASTQLTGASFSMAMAMIAGVTLLYRVGRSAIPLALALSWALFSIGANLGASAAGTPGAFRAKCVQELGLEAVNQLWFSHLPAL